MASSPNGLKSTRNCCAPFTVVPSAKYQSVAAARAQGSTARSSVRRRARAPRPPGRRRPRRRRRAPASPACRRPGRASPRAASRRTVRDDRRGVTAGHHRDRRRRLGVGDAGDQDRLVGAAVGGRRAFGAVPRRRQRILGGNRAHRRAAPRSRTALGLASTTSRLSNTIAGRPTTRDHAPDRERSGRGSGSCLSRSYPLPPERLVVEYVGQGVVTRRVAHAHARVCRGAEPWTRTRVRRHQRNTTSSQIRSATAEHRPALPLLAVVDAHRRRRS